MNRRAGDLDVRALGDEPADEREPSAPGCRPEHRDTVSAALIDQPGMLPGEGGDGICIAPARQHKRLLEHVLGRTVVHEARRGPPQQVHNGGLRPLADAGCLHGCTEVAEPPGGLAGRDEPMQMAALHADIPDAADLTSEDRLEKLLQTFPFARAAASKVASELPIALETVVEAIDDHADARTVAKSCEEAGASGHRRPPADVRAMPRIIGCTLNRVKPAPRIRVLLFVGKPNWDLLPTVTPR